MAMSMSPAEGVNEKDELYKSFTHRWSAHAVHADSSSLSFKETNRLPLFAAPLTSDVVATSWGGDLCLVVAKYTSMQSESFREYTYEDDTSNWPLAVRKIPSSVYNKSKSVVSRLTGSTDLGSFENHAKPVTIPDGDEGK